MSRAVLGFSREGRPSCMVSKRKVGDRLTERDEVFGFHDVGIVELSENIDGAMGAGGRLGWQLVVPLARAHLVSPDERPGSD
nr:hypothetical protein Iba_chr04aCG23020 [Ipomoea batatas]GME08514.1 hypothetical protein Iba_scaffold7731CG0060 [Ipomoea batatas]